MDNNEIEILRKVINEEINKQLEPIVCSLKEIKEKIEDLYLYIEAERREKEDTKNQEPIIAIKQIIKSEISQISYDTWIADCEGVIEGNIWRWFCANTFTQDILDKRYAKLVLNACKALNLNIKEVKFLVVKNK